LTAEAGPTLYDGLADELVRTYLEYRQAQDLLEHAAERAGEAAGAYQAAVGAWTKALMRERKLAWAERRPSSAGIS